MVLIILIRCKYGFGKFGDFLLSGKWLATNLLCKMGFVEK